MAGAQGEERGSAPPLLPSATVMVIRDRPSVGRTTGDLEVLLVQRAAHLETHGGAWAFPGGRVEAADFVAHGSRYLEPAARSAAVRETREETCLDLSASPLTSFAHWTAPSDAARRFTTWFFLAPAPSGEVVVDGSEICDYRWITPPEAIAARQVGTLELAAPTFVSLDRLSESCTVADAVERAAREPIFRFTARSVEVPDGFVSLYRDDVAYEDVNRLHDDGRRHRLWMLDGGWSYERFPGPVDTGRV